jgi:hypothetical protein
MRFPSGVIGPLNSTTDPERYQVSADAAVLRVCHRGRGDTS